MRAPSTFDGIAVDEFRSGPTLGRAEHDHGPARTFLAFRLSARPRGALNLADLRENGIERTGQSLMHDRRIVAFDEMRVVAVAAHQLRQFLPADARQHRRIGDLEAVEVKDRKDRPITCGIQKLVGMPTRGQRSRFPPHRRR